ncbi:hypothetical protein BHU16_06415 [Tannerella sp. oral taxon 808]|nr:hypothetical protein BHU16_06415 [Tannerella sp. oral taxon 808]
MRDVPLNEEESMALIAEMIRNTQRKMERGAGTPMLVWGYATVLATLAVWAGVTFTGDYRAQFLWFLIPVIGLTWMLFQRRQPPEVRTYVDKVVSYIWIVMGWSGFIVSCLSFLGAIQATILFIITLMMGQGSVLTGLVTRFRPLIIGGIVALLLSVALLYLHTLGPHLLIFALAFVAMGIIPGHILNRRAKKACSPD